MGSISHQYGLDMAGWPNFSNGPGQGMAPVFDKPARRAQALAHDFPRRPHFADYYHHSWNG
ncbi:MAG TPA: hypothetical protein DHL02_28420, partial [Achromobacter sp.]|nr:hypothetical protein [Achromobacter sp.]